MENIVKRIHITITSTPFSILRDEIYKVLDVSSDGGYAGCCGQCSKY